MPLDVVRHAEAVQFIFDELSAGRGGWAITPNLDQLRLYRARHELRDMYERAELVVADGMPLVWASRLQGTPLPERVAGSEMIETVSAAAAREGRSVYLLGGNPGAADAAAAVLARQFPGLRVVGTRCPPFGFEKDPAEIQAMGDDLEAKRPDVVFVGLGFPKQEHLIEALRPLLPGAWFLGIGISFSFVSGEVRQAPRWMRRTGLEWAHRLWQEPGRLFRRYVVHDIPFAARLFAAAVRGRFGKSHDQAR